ncbi:hypothetical protein MNB_SV-5-569 [hydrothermal vent metagenome]|uniref:RDD domain-containing protein n=1 Tax=hydrothermal vent metagenome TaxID=652676 RepID=A0A1W1EC48_9ZZZZ
MEKEDSVELSSTKKRIGSFVIDDIIVSIFLMIIFYDQIAAMLTSVDVNPEMTTATVDMMNSFFSENLMIIFAIKVIYHTVLVWQNGMTIGKYIMKIRVISLHTQNRPTFQQAFMRASVRLISDTFFYLGYIMAFFTPMRQTLHDKLSSCVVIDA